MAMPRSALFMLLLCGACSSEPDVVATARAGGALPFEGNEKCVEGAYKGSFFTWPGDGGTLSLSGTIEFALVKSSRGEFPEIGPNTKLEGKDLDARVYFTADVATQRCVAGSYKTEIVNGKFSGLDENDDPTPGYVEFKGEISGAYSPELRTFSGVWETSPLLNPGNSIKGGWVATLGSQ
jgi:hypothetical protein